MKFPGPFSRPWTTFFSRRSRDFLIAGNRDRHTIAPVLRAHPHASTPHAALPCLEVRPPFFAWDHWRACWSPPARLPGPVPQERVAAVVPPAAAGWARRPAVARALVRAAPAWAVAEPAPVAAALPAPPAAAPERLVLAARSR